jgi:hypothetical protein
MLGSSVVTRVLGEVDSAVIVDIYVSGKGGVETKFREKGAKPKSFPRTVVDNQSPLKKKLNFLAEMNRPIDRSHQGGHIHI